MMHAVRTTRWKDFLVLTRLQRAIAYESRGLAYGQGDKFTSYILAFLKAVLHHRRTQNFVCLDQTGRCVGFLTFVIGKVNKVKGTAYIVMGVLEGSRGEGIGTSLMRAAEAYARDRKMHRIELEVFESNIAAIGLYEKEGYVVEGRRREAIRTEHGYEDVLWMGKLLD